MYRFSLLLMLASLFFSTTAFADQTDACPDEVIQAVAVHYELAYTASASHAIVDETCKVWSYNDNLMLSAFAYNPNPSSESDFLPDLELYVSVFDLTSKQLISTYTHTIPQDATVEVGDNSLSLDTARYDLAPGTRAFGLRFHSVARESGAAEADYDDYLTLFIGYNGFLRPVLGSGYLDGGVSLFYEIIHGGCMKCFNPDQTIEIGRGTAHVLPTTTNGFHDLCFLFSEESDDESPKKSQHNPQSIAARCSGVAYKYNGHEYEYEQKTK